MAKELVGELKDLCEVSLPEDVIEDDFGKLNKALSMVQANNVRVTQLAVEKLNEVADLRKKKSALRVKYDLRRAQVFAEDEDVKAGKNAPEREALADLKLKDELVAKEKADAAFRDAEAELSAIEYVLSCLKSAKEIAGKQLDTVQKEIDLGMITPESVRK